MKLLARVFLVFTFFNLQTSLLEGSGITQVQNGCLTETSQKKIHSRMRSNNVIASNDFFLASFPKSGSHLAIKLLMMLTGRDLSLKGEWNAKSSLIVQLEANEAKRKNQFLWLHLSQKECDLFNEFRLQNPSYVKILQIRDLRDSLVSLVHHFDTNPHFWPSFGLDKKTPFNEKLKYVLSGVPAVNKSPILIHAKNAVALFNDPDTLVMRFEDIVGPMGGGDLGLQQQTIKNLAYTLGIDLSTESLDYLIDNLFGTDTGPSVPQSNFRKGQIGSWKEYFNEEHIKLFNEIWGDYQQALGYPLAE